VAQITFPPMINSSRPPTFEVALSSLAWAVDFARLNPARVTNASA
jgi:hypothetical protein